MLKPLARSDRHGLLAGWLVLLAFVCGIASAFADDPPTRPFSVDWQLTPHNRPLSAIQFLDAATGWAVGHGGTIMTTRDGGRSWRPQRSGTVRHVRDLHFHDARTGWAVGDNGLIVATMDGGTTWAIRVSGTMAALTSVHFADARTGWAVGQLGAVVTTDDGGETWKPQRSGTQANLLGVHFHGAQHGVAVGEFGMILMTRDGGKTWNVAPRRVNTGYELRSVHLHDNQTGFAVGMAGTILVTRDGGESWNAQASGTERHLSAVRFSDARTGWAAGQLGTILVTRDGGETWATQDGGGINLNALYAHDGEIAWAAGDGGTILVTRDGGARWATQRVGTPLALADIHLHDARTGWAVGEGGVILATSDGGAEWQLQPSDTWAGLTAVHFHDARTGWAVGTRGTILATGDGGASWQRQASGTDVVLTSTVFRDARTGWAIGARGLILATRDGGQTWQSQPSGTASNLFDVACHDALTCWIVGAEGTILVTRNGGETWTTQRSGATGHLLRVHVQGARHAWAVGAAGAIVATRDGGERWTEQRSGTESDLWGVQFHDDRTGWAVGARGTILATRNGGENWTAQPSGVASDLFGVRFHDPRTGWVVGQGGTIIRAGLPKFAPAPPENVEVADRHGNVVISLRFTDGDSSIRTAALSAAYAKVREPIDVAVQQRSLRSAGLWRFEWSPSSLLIPTGTPIDYQLRIDDGGPPLPRYALGRFTYDPWWAAAWREHRNAILIGLAATSLLVAYAAVLVGLFWLAPARLATMGAPLPEGLERPSGNLGAILRFVEWLLEKIMMPRLARHGRVRRAWLRRYVAGDATLAQLARPVRESFVNAPELLDAWVARHATMARTALAHVDLFEKRRVYVALPVRLGDQENGELIAQPGAAAFRPIFARKRSVVCIVGGGGTGKSTLACAMARWALAEGAGERLAGHQMVPVFITQETTNLLESIRQALRRMLGDEELPEDLLRALLAGRRVLVILDALSEREDATQRHVESIFGQDIPLNAVIVTSRREPAFEGVERAVLYPERLSGELLVPFIFEYLRRRNEADLFSGRQQVKLGAHVLGLVEGSGGRKAVTPLFAKLYIDGAVERVRGGFTLDDMPAQLPEVFLDYLRRVNPTTGPAEALVPHELAIAAARGLATLSLGGNLVPSDVREDDAVRALSQRGLGPPAERLIDRLVANGVLERQELGGVPMLRFSLDPAAEYVGAIDRIQLLDGDRAAWSAWLEGVRDVPGFPTKCDGFLAAFAICYAAYRVAWRLPDVDLPWESTGEREPGTPQRLAS